MRTRSLLLSVVAAVAFGSVLSPARAATPPDIRHVWIVVLENKDYADSFGPDSEAPFLSKTLPKQGKLLTNYYGTSHLSLGNYLTMVSGQAVNPITQADCQQYMDIFPGVVAPDGQTVGSGCVFPKEVKTVADQLEEKGLSWKGYMEDMGNTPGAPSTCRHPAIGAADDTQSARANDQYATRHNPFVYFHSIIDDQKRCDAHVVPLDRLQTDIKSAATTPNYAFITPDLCSDGHDATCADGGLGGLPAVDVFLQKWVPIITGSPGFKDHGLLLITWDEADVNAGGPLSSDACCGEQPGPSSPLPGIFGLGGGRTGSVIISPFVKAGTTTDVPYNHYSMLRSVEDVFGLGHLGYAAADGLVPFGKDVYDSAPTPVPPVTASCVGATKGRAVAAVRLRSSKRGALLTFRGRRSGAVRIVVTHRGGRRVTLRRLRSVRACRHYQVLLPADIVRAAISGKGGSVPVARTAALRDADDD